MEQKILIRVMLLLFLLPVVFTACKQKQQQPVAETKKQTYTCSMHPQIVRDAPGNCPICGMELVPFDKDNVTTSLTLGDDQIALANITTMVAGNGAIDNYKYLNGRLVTDPAQTTFISSRVAGRVEVLNVKETGVQVSRGQLLYSIYSEQLAALQQEYLLAVAQVQQFPADAKFAQIEKAAREKLLLYGQSDTQLKQLVQSQQVKALVPYYAPSGGTVAELSVTEGQYVPEGGNIMRLESYQQLWVEADLYPAEAAGIRVGQQVKVVLPGWEAYPQMMTVQFISPAYQSASQVLQLRGTIPNLNGQWQPGLQANILLPQKSDAKGMRLPVDAVMHDGRTTHVWVETGKGVFEARAVKTGMENADLVEVTEGIAAGERIVVTGAYLLYSEYILKKGANPMAEHHH